MLSVLPPVHRLRWLSAGWSKAIIKKYANRFFLSIERVVYSSHFSKKQWILFSVGGAISIACALFFLTLPDVSDVSAWIAPESVVVTDRNGRELYHAYEKEDRVWVDGNNIPLNVKNAFIAIEDRRFYSRGCIDVRALSRAALANVSSYKSQGASTITQQLVRTAFLGREKKFSRKIREIVLACELETSMSKDDILTAYLNWIPFGGGIAGVQQASHRFFGKDPADLTVAEAAVLASLPQRPTYFSPYGPHRYTTLTPEGASLLASGSAATLPQTAVVLGLTGTAALLPDGSTSIVLGGRAHQVLADMHTQGFISDEEKTIADTELLSMRFQPNAQTMEAPHYVLDVLGQLQQHLPDDRRGRLSIKTTIDLELQRTAKELVDKHAKRVAKKYDAHGVALVLADVETGEILAYVGNTDYFTGGSGSKIDMGSVARQPGSSFKPIVYATAMIHGGWKPETMVSDTPIERGGIRPRNYAGDFLGSIPVIQALNYSRNIPAIRAYDAAGGEQNILDLAYALGVHAPRDLKEKRESEGVSAEYNWPLAIGAAEVSLREMVEAYAVFAKGGIHRPLTDILSVDGQEGVLDILPEAEERRVLPAAIADTMTAMLSESRSRPAGFWRDATDVPGIQEAVKTGTSNMCFERTKEGCKKMLPRDVWALGFTPQYIVGVWMGNVDGAQLTANADGLNAAIPLWKDMLLAAHKQSSTQAKTVFAGAQRPYFDQHPLLNPNYKPDPSQPPTWIGDMVQPKIPIDKKEVSAL